MIPLQTPPTPEAVADSISAHQQELELLKSLPLDELIGKVVNGLITLAMNLAIAALVFYIGRFFVNRIYSLLEHIFEKRKVDRSLATFVLSMVRVMLYFILAVIVIGILGIETSSFLALFASAGVAIGMALSGTLQNFAGGVLILLLKPYKIGDYIEAQGYAGTVREIQIFNTIICTGDNKTIIIPNGGLSTGSVNNYSKMAYRRVDWTIGISYGNDVDVARAKILEILCADPDVVGPIDGEPTANPAVVVAELAESSVNLRVTAWTTSGQYWTLFYRFNELIYKQFESVGISFPFPQLDVHVSNN